MTQKSLKAMTAVLFLILLIGLLSLYSSCHLKGVFIKQDLFSRQLLWIGLGVCLLMLMARLDYRRLSFYVVPLYAGVLLSLVLVLLLGRTIMGSQRWLSFGFFSLQPSEIGKVVLIIALAAYFSRKGVQDVGHAVGSLNFSRGVVFPLAILLPLAFLVVIQPDLGTAVVYVCLFCAMAFLVGLRLKYLVGLALAAFLSWPFFWGLLRDYQKSRLLVFLNPNSDPLGAGYTMIQSKIAIGSGRLFGKGWMAGTQSQLNFLAERHTDFIFSVLGEEWGFFGGLVLLSLYAVLILMILNVAERSSDMFGRLLAGGIAFLIFLQVFVNIAMNIGMSPVVGLPLPFISYGGSSMVVNLAAIGIVFSIAQRRG